MQVAASVVAALGVALLTGFVIRAQYRPFFRLPMYAARVIGAQPQPPRAVRVRELIVAVLGGLDGATYAASAVLATGLGVYLFVTKTGIGKPIAVISIAAGLMSHRLP